METIGISGGGDTPPTQKELCHAGLCCRRCWFKSASGPLFRRPFQPAELETCELRPATNLFNSLRPAKVGRKAQNILVADDKRSYLNKM